MNINNLPEPYRTLAFIRREQRDRTIYHNHTDVLEAAFGWADHNEGYFWGNIQKGKLPPLTEQSIKDIVNFVIEKEGLGAWMALKAININPEAFSGPWGEMSIDMDKVFLNPIGAKDDFKSKIAAMPDEVDWSNQDKSKIYPIFTKKELENFKKIDVAEVKEIAKQTGELVVSSKSTMEIKVTGCDDCPFKQVDDYGCQSCSHPFNHYDGNKDEWFEYCPLKQADTVVKFEKPQK